MGWIDKGGFKVVSLGTYVDSLSDRSAMMPSIDM
jgi:hypothetical protein